ncbi:gluconolaconase, partial [Klebsiella pneumoniae]
MMKTALALSVALVAGSTALNALAAEAHALPALSELAQERAIGKPEVVATFSGAMPTGVTVTETGRIFVNFPRWGDDVPFTVAEVKGNQLVPYP